MLQHTKGQLTRGLKVGDRSEHGGAARPVIPAVEHRHGLAIGDVELDPTGYWGAWQQINATGILLHCYEWMERVGWIDNFRAAAAGTLPSARRGREFTDSDVFKLIEALSWETGRKADPALEEIARALIEAVAAAQDDDGYLNTQFGRPGQKPRYSDMEWGHELYNYGHLLQAAVARARTAGRDTLFEAALRVADHVCEVFGPTGRNAVCGHPVIELGLIEFGRLTGDERYGAQAELFLERRGTGTLAPIEFGQEYFQDDMPLRDATVFRGHAVRALYLAAAAVDRAVDTDDESLRETVATQLAATIARRTYVTGGMGSHHQDEAFGADFELPSDRAYCETCAGVASAMLAWRLLLATGEERYGDQLERVLHNVVATSPAPDGRAFFYSNTLHQRTPGVNPSRDDVSLRASGSARAAWFEVSCCPTNVARTFATFGCYMATHDSTGVQLHLYTPASMRLETEFGTVDLAIETAYPDSGEITVVVREAPLKEWTLSLRVPEWASGAIVEHNGKVVSADAQPGAVAVRATFAAGDNVRIMLPFEPRFTFPDGRIDAVRGTVAVERGPEVYCLESADLPQGTHVDDVVVDTTVAPVSNDGGVFVWAGIGAETTALWPYTPRSNYLKAVTPGWVRLHRYSDWGTRGPGTMRIWMRSGQFNDPPPSESLSQERLTDTLSD